MKLTHENILAGATPTGPGMGAWNAKQLLILGIQWPPRKGWLSSLIGTDISDADYARFVELRGQKRRKPAIDRKAVPAVTERAKRLRLTAGQFRAALRHLGIDADNITNEMAIQAMQAGRRSESADGSPKAPLNAPVQGL